MLRRLLGVALLVTVLTGLVAVPAVAVEEDEEGGAAAHGPLPGIDEIGTQSEISRQFFPEESEEAPFTPALVYPLLIVGFLVVFLVLVLYLRWQPRFANEDQARRR